MKRNKKAQEEIVGFILIILLVTIISLVFLAISIRKPSERLESREIESFIQASMRYSTECYASNERRYDLKDLIVSCSNLEICMNEKEACEVLNYTLAGILDESWKPCPECPVKSYKFDIKSDNKTMMQLKKGNCTGIKTFSHINIPSYSDIKAELEICG